MQGWESECGVGGITFIENEKRPVVQIPLYLSKNIRCTFHFWKDIDPTFKLFKNYKTSFQDLSARVFSTNSIFQDPILQQLCGGNSSWIVLVFVEVSWCLQS